MRPCGRFLPFGHVCRHTDGLRPTSSTSCWTTRARASPSLAVVANRLGDVLAFTSGYQLPTGPVGLLDAPAPNLIRFTFTDPRARLAYPDWDHVADEHVARLKTEFRRNDPHIAELVDELSVLVGAPFTDRLNAPPVPPKRAGVERLAHPEAGQLRLAYEILELPDPDEQRLIVHLPADDPTSAALDQLAKRQPGALRVVAG
jgi:hypothetical protein